MTINESRTRTMKIEFSLRLCKITGRLKGRLYYPTAWSQTFEFTNLQAWFQRSNKGREYPHLGTQIIWFEADLEAYNALYDRYPSQTLKRCLQTEMFLNQVR